MWDVLEASIRKKNSPISPGKGRIDGHLLCKFSKMTNELKNLSDDELLSRTHEVAQKERRVTLEMMRYLREVDQRQLFLQLGYSSLYDFVIRDLKCSEGASYRRIQAMRLIKDIPEAEEKISTGLLTLSLASKVQAVACKWPIEDKRELLKRVEGKSTREADREFAKADPKGPREFSRWLNGETIQLTFCLERPDFVSLQELQSIRSHVDVAKTFKVIFTDLIKLGQKHWNPLQREAPPAVGSPRVNPIPRELKPWRTVSPKLHDAVWQRDQGQCTYKHPVTGARCTTRDLLQIDHIHPLALGGRNELSNLRLLCAPHNRARAKETFGIS